jgi:aromatic ring-opening dioxygenase LigB subunit
MIGNIDIIIDNVSDKNDYDRRIVEVIARETFKRLKTRMVHSNALALYITQLGHFIPMHTRLRKYIWETLKKVRKQRKRIQDFTELLESAREESRITLYTTKLESAKMWEGIYVYNLKNALIQLNAIRTIWYERTNRRKISKLKREQEINNEPA